MVSGGVKWLGVMLIWCVVFSSSRWLLKVVLICFVVIMCISILLFCMCLNWILGMVLSFVLRGVLWVMVMVVLVRLVSCLILEFGRLRMIVCIGSICVICIVILVSLLLLKCSIMLVLLLCRLMIVCV